MCLTFPESDPNDLAPDVLANYLVTNVTGLRTMVKAGTDETELEKMVGVIAKTVR